LLNFETEQKTAETFHDYSWAELMELCTAWNPAINMSPSSSKNNRDSQSKPFTTYNHAHHKL